MRSSFIDQAMRTAGEYKREGGDREAAALSYFGFLSLFPLITLAIAVFGLVIRDDAFVRAQVLGVAGRVLPGSELFLITFMDAITTRAEVIGIVGLGGLLYSGLRSIDTLRGALDRVFEVEKPGGLKAKLRDVRFAAVGGSLLVAGVVAASAASGGAAAGLRAAGFPGLGTRVVVTILSVALTLAVDLALFTVLFVHLPDHSLGWRDVRTGALLAAVGFLILKTGGGFVFGRSASGASAASGVAAGVFGLLIVINVSAKLTLFAAEWSAQTCRAGAGLNRAAA